MIPLLLFTALILVPAGPQLRAGEPTGLLPRAQADVQGVDSARSPVPAARSLPSQPASTQTRDDEVATSEKLALAARARGDFQAALSDLINAQKNAPNNPRLLYDTAVLEDSMRLYYDADATVRKLQAMPGGDQPAVEYLAARVKMDLGQLDAATERMRAYLKARPGDASAHYGLGRMLQLKENFAEAKAQFQQSLALAPHQTESQFQLGEIALAQDQYDEAIGDYAQTLAGDPKHAGALAGTGIAWFHLRQYAKAEAVLRQAIAADPDYQPAHYYLGLTLAREGKRDAAQKELAEATAMEQKQAQAAAERLRIGQGAGATPPHQP